MGTLTLSTLNGGEAGGFKKGQAYTLQPANSASDTERMGQDGLIIAEATQFAH